MNKPKKRKLGTKLIIGMIIYSLLNLIIISLVVASDYAYDERNSVAERASGHARAAARFIDGDHVLDYLQVVGTDENGKAIYYTDEQYDNVMNFLVCTQAEAEYLLYYYVFVPQEDGIVYVWDAYTADDYSPCGVFEPYSEKGKEVIPNAFISEPPEKSVLIQWATGWGDLATAYYPIYNSAGEPVAMVGADLSVDNLTKLFIHSVSLVVGALAIVTVISSVIAYILVKKRVLKPIEQLNDATQDLVYDLDSGKHFDLEINTGDELEELADSFRKMDTDLRNYLDSLSNVTTERERVHAEFDIARKIQAGIIPHDFPAFPERNDFDLYAKIDPCEGIGGDFYDFFLIDGDHLAMVVGDVCERGVAAALYMVMVQTLIKNRAMQGFTPAEVLQSISEQMLEKHMDLFSTIWLAIVDLSTGKGIAANAGHQHPFLYRSGGKYEIQKYYHSPPVGALEGVRFRDHGFQLHPGDALFIYSDGVRDAMNAEQELFGAERIAKALNRDPESTPSVMLQTVTGEVSRFIGDTVQQDDLGMLCMKYYGPGSGKKPAQTPPAAEAEA